jgi:ankyrin repeat protein
MIGYPGNTALQRAAHDGRSHDIIHLLHDGADIEEVNALGLRVLHTAAHSPKRNIRSDVVEILLDHGADVNSKGRKGNTALHYACMDARVIVMRQLLKNGADVNVRTNVNHDDPDDYAGGNTPLHHAITYRSMGAIKLLLAHGADISIKEGEGMNSLHMAVMRSNRAKGRKKAVRVVQLLLAHGTDVYVKIAHLSALTDSNAFADGHTPEQCAHYEDVKEMLHSALLRAHETHRAKMEAFTMGQHRRLGAGSWVSALDPNVVQMIMDHGSTAAVDAEAGGAFSGVENWPLHNTETDTSTDSEAYDW